MGLLVLPSVLQGYVGTGFSNRLVLNEVSNYLW